MSPAVGSSAAGVEVTPSRQVSFYAKPRYLEMSPQRASATKPAKVSRRFHLRGLGRRSSQLDVAICDIKLGRYSETTACVHGAWRHHGRYGTEQPRCRGNERLCRASFRAVPNCAPIDSGGAAGRPERDHALSNTVGAQEESAQSRQFRACACSNPPAHDRWTSTAGSEKCHRKEKPPRPRCQRSSWPNLSNGYGARRSYWTATWHVSTRLKSKSSIKR